MCCAGWLLLTNGDLCQVIRAISIVAFVVGASTTFASGMAMTQANASVASNGAMQFGVSAFYDEMVDDFAMGIEMHNNRFEAGINGSVDRNTTKSDVKYTEYYVGAFAGVRKALRKDVYGSIGIMGNYGFHSGDWDQDGLTHNPYTLGAYVGFAYQPQPYIQVFARVMPVSYERNNKNKKEWEIFQEGQVGLAYYFTA